MAILYITWNPNPEIFHIGEFSFRWYGLSWALSFFLGYLLFMWFLKKENENKRLLDSLTTYMVIGTVLGARLGHCLFYEPGIYLRHPLEILKLWNGGMASHGAAIGILSSLLVLSVVKKINYFWLIDRIVICVALSGFLIRMGNLMNSEIIGTPSNLPWAFIFSGAEDFSQVPRHPAQLYEALWCVLVFTLLFWFYHKKYYKNRDGILLGIFLFTIFAFRFLIEFIKEKQVDFEYFMTLNMGQWLSIPFALAGLVLIIIKTRKITKTEKT